MKYSLIIISLLFSFQAYANDQAKQLTSYLNGKKTLSHELMWENGRIGELFTRAEMVIVKPLRDKKDLIKVVDNEIKRMVRKKELFRHEKRTIDSLYSLIRDGSYQVIYKTGENFEHPNYATDGIEKDLLSLIHRDLRDQVGDQLEDAEYAYLRTWTTVSEYDGMEKFFIKLGKRHVVILTIDNCGGC